MKMEGRDKISILRKAVEQAELRADALQICIANGQFSDYHPLMANYKEARKEQIRMQTTLRYLERTEKK
jgi:hypothetical protein